jgi:hypothetical protein
MGGSVAVEVSLYRNTWHAKAASPGHLSGRVARPLCARSRHGGRHRLTRTPSIRCEILYLTDRNAALASGRRTRPPRSPQDRHRRRCLPGRRIRRACAFERDPVQQLLFQSRREPVCPPWLPWASAGRTRHGRSWPLVDTVLNRLQIVADTKQAFRVSDDQITPGELDSKVSEVVIIRFSHRRWITRHRCKTRQSAPRMPKH